MGRLILPIGTEGNISTIVDAISYGRQPDSDRICCRLKINFKADFKDYKGVALFNYTQSPSDVFPL